MAQLLTKSLPIGNSLLEIQFFFKRRRVAYIDGVVGWSSKYFENSQNKCCEGFYATGGGFGRAFCLYDKKVKEEEEER